MITRLFLSAVVAVSACVFAPSLSAQTSNTVEFPAPSPGSTLKQRVGFTDVEINYSRPGVKGRKIFGGLLPYGDVWRAGANAPTRLTVSTLFKLNGSPFAAGTYGLLAIPGLQEWTIIIVNLTNQTAAYTYKPADDVLRFTVKPVALAEPVETFTIDINDIREQSATLNLIWEKTRVPVKLEVDTAAVLVPKIEAALAAPGVKPAALYFNAAQFYYESGQDLAKARDWVNEAIKLNDKAANMMLLKARILAKLGDKEGATAAAKKSAELGVAADGAKSAYVKLSEDFISSLK